VNHPDELIGMDAFINKAKGNVFDKNVGIPPANDFRKAIENIDRYGIVMEVLKQDDYIQAFRRTHQRMYFMFQALEEVFMDCDRPETGPVPSTGIHLPWAAVYSTWMLK
jgi:hypothetical protein